MKTSQQGLAEIASHEGIVMSRYKDSVGVWTIGIGHTDKAGPPDPRQPIGPLSIEEVFELFARDITKYEKRVKRAFTRQLSQQQFDAAVSFDFNTGGILRASWVKHFNAGDDAKAKIAFMAWSKPKSIIKRRRLERRLFFDQKYSGHGWAMAYPATKSGKILWSQGRRVQLPVLHTSDSKVDNVSGSQPHFEVPPKIPEMRSSGPSNTSSTRSLVKSPMALLAKLSRSKITIIRKLSKYLRKVFS